MTSLTSSGKSLLEKAKTHPDKLKAALGRMKTEGVLSVIQKARDNQSREAASGYSAAGVVLAVAEDVQGFQKGARVAVAGAGFANHAELVAVPINLTMIIPDDVSFGDASSCALGGIALQGVRRAETTLGEMVAVIGCGAIGLLTIQLLKAAGCNVIAIDLEPRRLQLAEQLGADVSFNARDEQLTDLVVHFADGHGVDRVIITAATQSNTVLSQAFGICRRKGRVVLVGVVGPELNRADMYPKELDFVISTSYGPGRYDEKYERFGHDYPYAYVRWTEKRNMEAYLKLISSGAIKLNSIIEDSFAIEDAPQAYARLTDEQLLLVTLTGSGGSDTSTVKSSRDGETSVSLVEWKPPQGVIRLGLVGAGSFMQSMHIPNLKRLQELFQVASVCDQNGLAARQGAQHFPGCDAMTDYEKLLQSDIDMVLIGTRHNSHAELAIRALEAGKAVFVEKPMCITLDEYERLTSTVAKTDAPFMVGYNRRFSPFAVKIRDQITNRVSPIILQYTMNAGYIPYSSWVHSDEGGGRIIGEGCHLIDLFRFLTDSPVVSVSVDAIKPHTASIRPDDNVVITIRYEDGSIGTLLYTAIGSTSSEKETLKVFCDERLFELHDYRSLKTFGVSADLSLKKQDKGHFAELQLFSDKVRNGERFPIPWSELKETWEITRQVADILRTGD
jgi:predicted dehydrogenase/threonine dehydrogenase-like Zn-dependent dehydrogenase